MPDRALLAVDGSALVLCGWLRFYQLQIIYCGCDRSIGTMPIAKVSRSNN
ncbi:hypothetical protein QUB70_26985 [Microcoleus sp. A003_D6]